MYTYSGGPHRRVSVLSRGVTLYSKAYSGRQGCVHAVEPEGFYCIVSNTLSYNLYLQTRYWSVQPQLIKAISGWIQVLEPVVLTPLIQHHCLHNPYSMLVIQTTSRD